MSDFPRPRGLGRGLSALLGEPVRADLAPTASAEAARAAWAAAAAPNRRARRSMPPRNVFELPIANHRSNERVRRQPAPYAVNRPRRRRVVAQADRAGDPSQQAMVESARSPDRSRTTQSRNSRASTSTRAISPISPTRSARTACCSRSSCVRSPGGKFEIVAGERRWRAAQRAGLHTIPAVSARVQRS